MHPLLSATAAKPPKLSTSASCPATTSDKSTICTPTVTKDVGLPATLYTKGSQAVQRYLKRARESCYKKKVAVHSIRSRYQIVLTVIDNREKTGIPDKDIWKSQEGKRKVATIGCSSTR